MRKLRLMGRTLSTKILPIIIVPFLSLIVGLMAIYWCESLFGLPPLFNSLTYYLSAGVVGILAAELLRWAKPISKLKRFRRGKDSGTIFDTVGGNN